MTLFVAKSPMPSQVWRLSAASTSARVGGLEPLRVQVIAEAQAAIKRHDWAGADAIYTRLLANPHGNPAMLTNNAAFVKIELGQPAAAVPLARKALAQSGNDPLVMDTLGWALFKAGGARDEAVQLLQAAAAALPGNASVQAHLAQARSAG